ncbi:MAG: hypothetical protein KAU50_08805 [Candidatus Marinimicrobia bacterium]|nr:hypothetical protein [Candidatus Neomarinimicrobiota bacterium]
MTDQTRCWGDDDPVMAEYHDFSIAILYIPAVADFDDQDQKLSVTDFAVRQAPKRST